MNAESDGLYDKEGKVYTKSKMVSGPNIHHLAI